MCGLATWFHELNIGEWHKIHCNDWPFYEQRCNELTLPTIRWVKIKPTKSWTERSHYVALVLVVTQFLTDIIHAQVLIHARAHRQHSTKRIICFNKKWLEGMLGTEKHLQMADEFHHTKQFALCSGCGYAKHLSQL